MPDPAHPSHLLLIAYAAGELASNQTAPLKAHLISCEACQAVVLATEEDEGRRLSSLPGEPLAADALRRALDQIDAESESPTPGRID